ncbi:MAG: hypothetical protein ABJG15_10570 [Hyphomonadaceae bacterium]
MAVGEPNPRAPRDFYHLFRPNTAIWIGRILPLMPWLYFAVKYMLDYMGIETNGYDISGASIAAIANSFVIQAILMLGMMVPSQLKGGVFQYTERQHMDEFEIRLVGKARLFAYRIMGVALLAYLPLLATRGPITELTGGANVAALSLAIIGPMLILFTVAPAYFHWSLKTVPADENIRPDPPFMSDEDVAKGWWRR